MDKGLVFMWEGVKNGKVGGGGWMSALKILRCLWTII